MRRIELKHLLAPGRLYIAAAALLCVAHPGASCAATLVETKPHAVTVFPRMARVIRTGEIRLGAGQQTVRFVNIPAAADDASIRLSLKGPRGTKLFGVQLKSAYSAETVQEEIRKLQERLQALEDQKADLTDQNTARTAEIDILKALAKDTANRTGSQAAQRPGDLEKLVRGTQSVGQRIALLLADSRKNERARRALDKKIAALRRELQQLGRGTRAQKIAEAELELPREGDVDFTLAYMLRSAGWSPLYDLRLETGKDKPKVALAFAAQVFQRTGEDWNDVKLVLSTARPTSGNQIPDPTGWWLDFAPKPRKVLRSKRARAAPSEAPAMARADKRIGVAALDTQQEEVKYAMAQAQRAEYATTFVIERAVTIPADGSRHRVGIADSSHDASLLLVTVPRLQQKAFIEATITYGGEQPLLPGPANIFRGPEFVGTTQLRSFAPGETFTVGLGQDEHVKVERKLISQQEGDTSRWLFVMGQRRYHWVTTLKNFHTGTRTIEVREQLPRSRQKDIVVRWVKLVPKPLPAKSQKPGLKRWRIKLKAQGKAQVTFSYSVKFPKGSRIIGLE